MARITKDKREGPADDLPDSDEEEAEESDEENADAGTGTDPLPHFLNPTYEAAVLAAEKIRGIIIGESPYAEEDGPTGVPFMTQTWEQLRNPVCSGQYVVQSVTGKWIYTIAKRRAKSSPVELATECLLGKHGVVLLNAAYSLPTQAEIMAELGPQVGPIDPNYKRKSRRARKKLIAEKMKAAWDTNKDLLQKILEHHSPLVILCGTTIENQIGMGVRSLATEVVNPCHPATFNVQTPGRYNEWLKYWDVGRVNEILKKRT